MVVDLRRGEAVIFAPLWNHIDECQRCSRVDLDLCPEGERLRAAVTAQAAAAIAPVVEEREGERE